MTLTVTDLRRVLGLTPEEYSFIRTAVAWHRDSNPLDFVLQLLLSQCGRSRMDQAQEVIRTQGYLFLRQGLLLPKDSADEKAHTLALFVLMHLTFPERYPLQLPGVVLDARAVFDCAAFGTGENLRLPPERLLVSRGKTHWRELERRIRVFSQLENKTPEQERALATARALLERHRLFGAAEGEDSSESQARVYAIFRELSEGLGALISAFAVSVGETP